MGSRISSMSKLKEILEKKDKRKTELKSRLDSIKKQLIDMGALKIVLFGSLANDETDVHSDLDLLVIMPSAKSGKEWMDFFYENLERGCSSDIIVFNQEEFRKKLPKSSFLNEVLNTGKVIYEKKL